MQTTDYAGYIRRAFMSEGLMGTVAKLPLERKFKLEHVKEVLGIVFRIVFFPELVWEYHQRDPSVRAAVCLCRAQCSCHLSSSAASG